MRDFEIFYQFLPYFMVVLFSALLFLVFYNRKVIAEVFRSVEKKTWIKVLLLITFGALLRFSLIPHEQIVTADGENVVELGMSVNQYGKLIQCNYTSDKNCLSADFPTYPPAYPVVLSGVFNFFEKSERTAFSLSSVIGALMILLSFLLAYLWTKKENVALLGAFVFGLISPILKFSGSVSLELFLVFFFLLTLIFFEIFIEKKNKAMFLLFLFALLCTTYIRPEGVFLIGIFFISALFRISIKELFKKIGKRFVITSLGLFFFLLIPSVIFANIGRGVYPDWNPSLTKTAGHFLDHYLYNLRFLFDYSINPLFFSISSFLGIYLVFLKEKKKFLFFFIPLLAYFTFYSSYESGIISGPFIRYFLVLYVFFFFFFVRAIDYFFGIFRKKKVRMIGETMILLLFLGSFVLTNNYILKENDGEVEPVKEMLLQAKERIPSDAYVVSLGTEARVVINRNTISANIFICDGINKNFDGKKAFLFKTESLESSPSLEKIKERYELNPVEVITYRGKEQGVYELVRKI